MENAEIKVNPVAPGGQVEPIIVKPDEKEIKNEIYDAEMVTDIPQEKECGQCTYLNSPYLTYCEVCGGVLR